MAERVLITGGAGFIGSYLAARHLSDGDEVHILVRPDGPSRPDRLQPGAAVHAIALDALAAIRACLASVQPSLIYHLAGGTGRDPRIPHPSNLNLLTQDLRSLLNLLAAAADQPNPPKSMVRAGSLAVYGDGPTPSSEEQRERPQTVYTAAMVAGGHYCQMLQPTLPFPVLTARLALTYGHGQSEDFFLPYLLRRCLQGLPTEVSRPNYRRDMVYVGDAVDGLQRLAASPLPGATIVNLASGTAPTVREIAAMAAAAAGADPSLLIYGTPPDPDLRVATVCGSPERARALLGWSATTSLPNGLARTVACMRQEEFA